MVNSCQPDIRTLTAPARDCNCEVFQPEASFLCSDQVSRSGRSRGYSEGDCHAPVPFVSLGTVGALPREGRLRSIGPSAIIVARCETRCYNNPMSDHFTLRFQPGVSERLTAHARLMGLAPRTLAQRLVDEGLRREDHPLIRFADGPSGRRAALVGSGLNVWEVIGIVRDNDNDPEEAASYLEIAPRLVQAAIAYYEDYREEVDAEVSLIGAEAERGYTAWLAGQQALAS